MSDEVWNYAFMADIVLTLAVCRGVCARELRAGGAP